MKNFVEKVKKAIPHLVEDYIAEETGVFDFIRDRNDMMKELDFCRKTGNLVGVYSKNLGHGLFLVGVEEINYGIKAELITFFPYDMSGFRLPERNVLLKDIEMIIPFNNRYVKPHVSIPAEVIEIGKYVNKKPTLKQA
jgi:hypothetical protein